MADRTELIIGTVAALLPSVIGLAKTVFAQTHPGQTPPTSAEVLLAFNSAVAKSLSVDEAWLAAHHVDR